MAFNPSIDVNSWKLIQWSPDVPKLDTQLTELMLKQSTWATGVNQAIGAPTQQIVTESAVASVTSQRIRGYSSIGNPNFEVDQRQVGNAVTMAPGVWAMDRWSAIKSASMTAVATAQGQNLGAVAPGTTIPITSKGLRITLTTAQASLGTGDVLYIVQNIEGPMMRELGSGAASVHSFSILVQSSVAGLSFGISLRDPGTVSRSLCKLCTLGAANTPTLITLPNLPGWASGGAWSWVPGTLGYQISITLAAGSTLIAPANDTWQTGNYVGAVGQSNFAASPVNSTFDLFFVQHEPGNICTALIDKPFTGANGNLMECVRYYQKSYPYGVAAGAVNSNGAVNTTAIASQNVRVPVKFDVRMAKAPTVTAYSDATGASGAVRDGTAAGDRGISSYVGVGDTGFGGALLSTVNANPAIYTFQWTADTGW